MAIYNLGSINIDHFYRLSHLPVPGETLAAESYVVGLGGKGANQSAAAAKAGARVLHLGAVGPEGGWAVDRLAGWGVDVSHVSRIGTPTGHAIINVDAEAENTIITFPGANRAVILGDVELALSDAGPGDTLILQNETAHQLEAARIASGRGMRVMYSAAPFDADALLALNAVEAQQLTETLGVTLDQLPVAEILVTKGGEGAEWRSLRTGARVMQAAQKVDAVDTTGAGDTFAGYFAAGLDEGMDPAAALRLAAAAAAIKVTRRGTADAIPLRAEVDAFLAGAAA
jgi:ribokinase